MRHGEQLTMLLQLTMLVCDLIYILPSHVSARISLVVKRLHVLQTQTMRYLCQQASA